MVLSKDEFDMKLLNLLKNGFTQKSISEIFREEGIKCSSVRSIELRINDIKEVYGAQSLFQLAFKLMDAEYFQEKTDNE